MIGHVARGAHAEERNAVGTARKDRHAPRYIGRKRCADGAAGAMAAYRSRERMFSIMAVRRMAVMVIVFRRMNGLRTAVMRCAQLSRDRRIAAQRQRGYDQKQDQDLESTAHEGNPITADFLADRSEADEFPFLPYQRRSFSVCRAQW